MLSPGSRKQVKNNKKNPIKLYYKTNFMIQTVTQIHI